MLPGCTFEETRTGGEAVPYDPQELSEALDRLIEHAQQFEKEHPDELPFEIGGYTQAQIDAHSATLDQPMPKEIAALFRRVKGSPTGGMKSVWLLELHETRWLSPADEMELSWFETDYPDWFRADYFAFGTGLFGDTLVYCPAPPGRVPGSIIMVDHEAAGPENNPRQPVTLVFYGDSLTMWLDRLAQYGYEEYGYVMGYLANLPEEMADTLRQDHARLNPGIFDDQ
jgi:hypothetical protein